MKATGIQVLDNQPITTAEWFKVDDINPNNYNPNIVAVNEMMGLKNSLLNNGWIFPITATNEGFIIDGYHRYYLSKNDPDIRKKYKGYVPVIVMDISIQDAMCMTVTMNNAKGTHQSSFMHQLVTILFKEFNMSKEEIAKRCTITRDEVDLLMQQDVFTKLNIDKHTYSKGWVPK